MRIAVLDDYLKVAKGLADWDSLQDEVVFFHEFMETEKLAQALKGFDAIVIMRERSRIPASLLDALPDLKLIVTTGLRNNAIDMKACKDRGVLVCGAPGSDNGGKGTAELAWAMLMALAKRIPQETENMRNGLWQTVMTPTLAGKRLGVVGLGKLGQMIARYGKAFDMDVVAWSPNLTDERAAKAGVTRVEKEELFSTSDFISLHLILGSTTQGIVDADSIARMKQTAYLINTSRSGLVDQNALRTALEQGKIAGAGIDVFDVEPLPADDPWRKVPNTVLTPHLGYSNTDNFDAYFPNAVEAIKAFKSGNPIRVLGQ